MGNPSFGREIKLATDDTTSFDTNSEPQVVALETLKLLQTHTNVRPLRGTRSGNTIDTRITRELVAGQIIMPWAADMGDIWLPRILGAAESTDTFALAETLPSFSVLVDRVADTHQYDGCYVSKAAWRGRQGEEVMLVLDIVGQTETTGNAYPSLTLSTIPPMLFRQGVLTLESSARDVAEIEIVVDNQLEIDWRNSVTAVSIDPGQRIVSVTATVPYSTDETDLYDIAVAGAAGTFVLTDGGYSTTFSFGNFKIPAESPVAANEGEVPLVLRGQSYQTGATKELVVTHDSAA